MEDDTMGREGAALEQHLGVAIGSSGEWSKPVVHKTWQGKGQSTSS